MVWGSSTNNKIGKLFKLQKKAIRTLSDKGYSQHTDPLFSKLENLNYLIYTNIILLLLCINI